MLAQMDVKPLAWIEDGGRMVLRSLRVKAEGYHRYSGDASRICSSILEDCWTGSHFMTSTGHFASFFARDFGLCVRSLRFLGQGERVLSSLEYALSAYERAGRISTTITPAGRVFDVFAYAPDSLAFVLHALSEADAQDAAKKHRQLLQKEIERCHRLCWDRKRGLVRADRAFSSIKDNASRKSSLYDNVMVALTAKHCDALGLDNPWKGVRFEENLRDMFWTGTHFREDLASSAVAGDANTFPFWAGIVRDKGMLKSAIAAVRAEGLDAPFPLKYTAGKPGNIFLPARVLAPNYEGNTVWAHLGLAFIEVVARADRALARRYLAEYTKKIEHYRTFLEVYSPDGTPYRTLLYECDEGMLWAANYLRLMKTLS